MEDFIFNRIWHVFGRDSVENPTDDGPSVEQGETTDGRLYVVAFTDSALVAAFLEKRNDPSLVAVEMASMLQWRELLEYLYDAGHEHIGIDPKEGGRFVLRPIASVVAQLKDQEH